MKNIAVSCAAFVAVWAFLSVVRAQTPQAKVDIVAVAGCLKETTPGGWSLVNASDPVVSSANAPSAKELATLPKGGKNEFRLIGVAVFNLPAHKDQSVVVKGLHIKDRPMSRLNVTSVTTVDASCPPRPQK
jgi:hypothetical protein